MQLLLPKSEVAARVLAVLANDERLTPRQINDREPLLLRRAITAALLSLVRNGRVTFDGEPNRRRYRRSSTPSSVNCVPIGGQPNLQGDVHERA